jgi:hypothetical protein
MATNQLILFAAVLLSVLAALVEKGLTVAHQMKILWRIWPSPQMPRD